MIRTIIINLFLSIIMFAQHSWYQQQTGLTNYLQDIFFLNNQLGWAVGYQGVLIKTTNSGLNWERKFLPVFDDILSVHFVNNLNGWIGTSSGKILKTTNGGDTWQIIQVSNNKVYSIYFYNDQIGIAACSYITDNYRTGEILKTTNGGHTWETKFSTGHYGLVEVDFLDERGWVVGTNGLVLSTADSGNTWIGKTITLHWLYDIFFIDKQYGWAVGGNVNTEAIFATNDGGNNWFQVTSSNQYKWITGVYFIDRLTGWVCGANGVILHTVNGGFSWIQQPSFTNSYLRKVFFPSTYNGFIAGDNGIVLNYKNVSINIIKPNGGENLVAGSNFNIEWNSQNVQFVKIEFSFNGGNSWVLVKDSLLSTGQYEWQVPNIFTNQGRIKISEMNNPSNFDISNNNFSIVSSKMIRVLYPNGGEIIDGNSNVDIRWTSYDVLSVKLEYSLTNGANWSTITESTLSSGIFSWIVPNISTIQGRVRITDISSPNVFDISDSTFRINASLNNDDLSNDSWDFKLEQNYPNPFNPSTKIDFSIPKESYVTLKVFDSNGNLVKTLISDVITAGNYSIDFHSENLSSGNYFCVLSSDNFQKTIKITLLK